MCLCAQVFVCVCVCLLYINYSLVLHVLLFSCLCLVIWLSRSRPKLDTYLLTGGVCVCFSSVVWAEGSSVSWEARSITEGPQTQTS